jgi:pyruvate-formate lyase
MLQARPLHLHEPPLSLRIHKITPDALWGRHACTKEVGGIPSLQNDDITSRAPRAGFTLEDARDYCIIGCVDPRERATTSRRAADWDAHVPKYGQNHHDARQHAKTH